MYHNRGVESDSHATRTKPHQAGEDRFRYRYARLPDENSIRMFTLNPGDFSTRLEGIIENFNITSAPFSTYESLSYVWGSSERTHAIECDGQDRSITASLFSALKRLRLRDQPRRLWVDQLCINQDDLVERSQQVEFMNKTYANANRVLVWLGPDEQMMAGSAFDRIRDLHNILEDGEHSKQRLQGLSEDMWVHLRHMTTLPWVSSTLRPVLRATREQCH